VAVSDCCILGKKKIEKATMKCMLSKFQEKTRKTKSFEVLVKARWQPGLP
jgi:hypothetical protein